MAFVLDASVSAIWALIDEAHPLAEQILSNWTGPPALREPALVPPVWWFELRNVLVVNERRKRLTSAESDSFLKVLTSFPIQTDTYPDEKAILHYARRYQLSFYDAAYLDVANRNGLPLATLDKALRQAAEAAGVTLLA